MVTGIVFLAFSLTLPSTLPSGGGGGGGGCPFLRQPETYPQGDGSEDEWGDLWAQPSLQLLPLPCPPPRPRPLPYSLQCPHPMSLVA